VLVRRRLLAAIVALGIAGLVAVVSGCASLSPAGPPSPSLSPAEASASPTPTPSPTPEIEPGLVVSVDQVTYEDADGTVIAALDDGAAVVALLEDIAGPPTSEAFEGPYGSEGGVRHRWDGVVVSVYAWNSSAAFSVRAPSLGDIPVATSDGVAVGDNRDAAIAAGAIELCGYDGDGDGRSDGLALELTEVAGTMSLCRDGSVGVEYVGLEFAGDEITHLFTPGNDFSDI
jgi:hypothetical protein